MRSTVGDQLERTMELLRPLRDVIAERVNEPSAPTWCARRGWSEYLLGLSDAELAVAEQLGLERALDELPKPPETLGELARAVRRLVDPYRSASAPVPNSEPFDHVPARKRVQVAAVLAACRSSFPRPRRVVELGAGRGHAARHIAVELGVPVVGIERDARLVRRARQLADGGRARFELGDGERGVPLGAGDLVLGLHACGELGDGLVRQAARAGAQVLLVSCCLQKIGAPWREPLSRRAQAAGLRLERSALGLTNLVAFVDGGQAEAVVRGRRARLGLRRLLAARGVTLSPGAEARGINRRKFVGGLGAVAPAALARRGLAAASDAELARYASLAASEHRAIRRLSLPRAMLGRVVELAVVLDRGCSLVERGYAVRVEPLFSRTVSPRNLALLATRDR